ncbi:hypothetical protein ACOMHN_049282 [Nucella lapillus]
MKTWEDARVTCLGNNQRLVHVTEKLEHSRIKTYSAFIFDHFWIGLKQENSEFKWTNDKVAKFTAWGQGQPSSQSECVRYSATNFQWETYNCSALLYFMCENDVPKARASDKDTMATGLLLGFGTIVGLLLGGVLMLQMPCCRSYTVRAIGQFGLGRR